MAIDLTSELLNENATAAADEVEGAAATSGVLPAGKYHARLEGAQQKELGNTPVFELTFEVIGGPYAGRKPRYSLWLGMKETDKDGNSKTPEQLQKGREAISNEFWHAAGCLGLATKKEVNGKSKYAYAKRKDGTPLRDFRDVLGAECIIETKLREYGPEGDKKQASEVKMFGIHLLSDPKMKDVVRAKPGERPAVNVPVPQQASRDLSDLA